MPTFLLASQSAAAIRVADGSTTQSGRIFVGQKPPTAKEREKLFAAPTFEQLRSLTKAHRDKLLSEGFSFQGKVIQTRNQADIENINGAAIKASHDPAFTTGWITADNSILPLDANGLIAMQSAMLERGSAIFAAYIAKVAELANANEAQLNAIDPEFTV